MLRRIFAPKKQEEVESGEDDTVKGFMICVLIRPVLGRDRHGG
jgi:hypothetical protein